MKAVLELMGRYSALLALFALICTALLGGIYGQTKTRIAANEEAELRQRLGEVLPDTYYDNALLEDMVTVMDAEFLGTAAPVAVYRAWKGGRPSAVVLAPVAPDGYSGAIRLLVGITVDGVVRGVRVVTHRETPGLGDGIEVERSDWILGFDGTSHTAPAPEQWRVKKDGGAFDQLTGATITPRAVVKAVDKSLDYFALHQQELFAAPRPSNDDE
ncbi:MAG: electron transport complex subunit RsxG [Gammaproteobacteria bacterium]|nr:electron transport complex subunit RsxG [Gammaproteobacteria bacterium]